MKNNNFNMVDPGIFNPAHHYRHLPDRFKCGTEIERQCYLVIDSMVIQALPAPNSERQSVLALPEEPSEAFEMN
ncbi:MAG: hypothetical protein P8012_10960 [Desulfobacterales bacterium]